MELFTEEIAAQLESNGNTSGGDLGHVPVVKIFGGPGTWLITDSDPGNPGHPVRTVRSQHGFP